MSKGILITGGRIIDPARGVNEAGDLYISGDRLAAVEAGTAPEISVDARGCIVTPGLIDYHTHVFSFGTENGFPPDLCSLPYGITTVVDAGSAGTANYEIFHTLIANSVVRIKSFLSVSPTGQATFKFDESHDPNYFDVDKMELLFRKYPYELLGLKLRLSKGVVGDLGLSPLKEALKIAARLSCRVAVHTTNPPVEAAAIASSLRAGDIFAHVYHGKGSTIIGGNGKVLPDVRRARERGVIFDAANGKSHFAYCTAEAALAEGFVPDVISSDLGWITMFKQPMVGLPWIISKYLALGLSMDDVVAACTTIPARLLGMEGVIGTLGQGACADIAIFKLIDQPCKFIDSQGESRLGDKLLIPQMTVRAGRIVFRQLNF